MAVSTAAYLSFCNNDAMTLKLNAVLLHAVLGTATSATARCFADSTRFSDISTEQRTIGTTRAPTAASVVWTSAMALEPTPCLPH